MSMNDSYSKEEADRSFVKEADFTDNVLSVLQESTRAEECIERIVGRYMRRKWHVLLAGLVMTAFTIYGLITFFIKTFLHTQ